MTATEISALNATVDKILGVLQGEPGETGLVSEVKAIGVELAQQGVRLEIHLTAHKECDTKKETRMWDIFKTILIPLAAGLVSAALVVWGLK